MDDWYDDECRNVTEEKISYILECTTNNLREEFFEARKTEKKVRSRKKREHANRKMEETEHLRTKNEIRVFLWRNK